jgi:hypothetical protein
MFPVAGDSLLDFFSRGAFAQFRIAFGSDMVAAVFVALYLAGLIRILVAYRRQGLAKTASMFLLLSLPFLLACAGAYARAYPFGHSRQTVFLAMFIAIGAGIALDLLSRKQAGVALVLTALIVPLWYHTARYNPITMRGTRNPESYHQMLSYIREHVPANSRILCEGDALMLLFHYLGGDAWPGKQDRYQATLGDYSFLDVAKRWENPGQIWEAVARVRGDFELAEDEALWVVDAYEPCDLCGPRGAPEPALPPEVSPVQFGRDALVLRIPPGYEGPNIGAPGQ